MASADMAWSSAPARLLLPVDEVHVWRASLEQPAGYIRELAQTLSPDERARAERFHFEHHRRHFIAGRGILRAILGRYLSLEPGQIRFDYTPHGKPGLAGPVQRSESSLEFNLTHSHELALYAFTYERKIGVDLEYLNRQIEIEQIAERFFSPYEVSALRALPKSRQSKGFFNCWTRKEAYIKAIGEGLALPLDAFDVSLAPGEPATLLRTRGDLQEAARWSLQALSPAPGYVAAVAVAGHGWRLKCWQYSGDKM